MRLGILLALCAALFFHFKSNLLAPPVPPTTADMRTYLIYYEGYRLEPYQLNGLWHVGIGHLIGPERPAKDRYTEDEVNELFEQDIQIAMKAAREGIQDFRYLPRNVQIVTIGLAFNVGPTGFTRFLHFRRALSVRAYRTAADELASSLWARQVSRVRVNEAVTILRAL